MPVVIPEQEVGRQQQQQKPQQQQQQQQNSNNGQRKSLARERLPEEVECEELAKELLAAGEMKEEKDLGLILVSGLASKAAAAAMAGSIQLRQLQQQQQLLRGLLEPQL